jgi:hypothetical protein
LRIVPLPDTQRRRPARLLIAVALPALGLLALPAGSARAQEDWPCVQRLVPRLEAGQMWSGPPVDTAGEASPEIMALATELADLSLAPDDLATKVRAFAEARPEADRARDLTRLFAAALAELNRSRASMIEGIKRYARRQQLLAAQIAEENRRLDQQQAQAGVDAAQLAELQSARDWDTRVYTDRQRQLGLVCEQPVRIEQRAFALARAIQEQLP